MGRIARGFLSPLIVLCKVFDTATTPPMPDDPTSAETW